MAGRVYHHLAGRLPALLCGRGAHALSDCIGFADAVRCELVEGRRSPITFQKVRLLPIGRITACTAGTSARPGMLLGSKRGLYYLPEPEAKLERLRRYPVGYILSGENGVVCYEEAGGRGRLAILDAELHLRHIDAELARTINPKAHWNDGLIVLHRADFSYLEFETGERKPLCEFAATRTLSPLAPVENGYEFVAIHRGGDWPTYLHRLAPTLDPGKESRVLTLAQAEDPLLARHFVPLPNGDYLAAPQGESIFLILRVFPGERASLRTWALVPIAGDAHPVGLVRLGERLFAACSDSLLSFALSEELLTAP